MGYRILLLLGLIIFNFSIMGGFAYYMHGYFTTKTVEVFIFRILAASLFSMYHYQKIQKNITT